MGLIEFKDKGFEMAIKNTLKIKTDKVTAENLLSINGILVAEGVRNGFSVPWSSDTSAFNMLFPNLLFNVNDSVNGLWELDLAHFSHIKSLHLYTPTGELSILREFCYLRELYVAHSETRDWTFLKGLLNLSNLYLRYCIFTDMTIIRDLCLVQQDLVQEKRAKGEGIKYAFVPRLKNVGLSYCGINNIAPLAGCNLISELNLSHNEISDLSPIMEMRSIYYLTMRYNKVEDITSFCGIT